MSATMQYRERAPRGELARFVLSFWEFRVSARAGQPMMHTVFPDGCTLISYATLLPPDLARLRVTGPLLQPRRGPVAPGVVAWGARLQPAACRAVLGCSPLDIVNATRPLSEIISDRSCVDLSTRLERCTRFRDAVAAFEIFLQRRAQPALLDRKMARAADRIARTQGRLRMTAVADAVGLGTRQLQRRFKNAVGLTPKQFARSRRFRAAAVALAKRRAPNWADVAAELGFADQAHLVHDFSAVAGIRPKHLAKMVQRIQHGRLIDPKPLMSQNYKTSKSTAY